MSINETLLSKTIKSRRMLVNVENGVVRQILTSLARVETEMAGKVVGYLGSVDPDTWLTAARQARILGDLQKTLNATFPRLERSVEKALGEYAEVESAMLTDRLRQAMAQLPEHIPVYRPPLKMIEEVASNFLPKDPSAGMLPVAEKLEDLKPTILRRLKREFTDAVARGDGAREIASTVRKVVGKDSITAHEARVWGRTQVQRVANDVARAHYYRNRHIAPRVQYVATLDKRTCLQCGGLDGKVYANGEAPVIPVHPQCRCFTTPVVASWRELGIPPQKATPEIRRLFNGRPAQRIGYGKWFREQPAATKRSILGASRYEDWRSGRVKFDDFSTDRRVLTVDEYRERAA